jgi:hypothetical protein
MRRLRWLIFLSSAVSVFGCGAPETLPPDDGTLSGEESDLTNSCTTTRNCNNCVYYARCRQPRLPTGLNTYADKVAIINRGTPNPGCVAIINTGNDIGHVAFVEYVNSYNGTVYISEGNWPYGQCGSRSGSASALRIVGYWCP